MMVGSSWNHLFFGIVHSDVHCTYVLLLTYLRTETTVRTVPSTNKCTFNNLYLRYIMMVENDNERLHFAHRWCSLYSLQVTQVILGLLQVDVRRASHAWAHQSITHTLLRTIAPMEEKTKPLLTPQMR